MSGHEPTGHDDRVEAAARAMHRQDYPYGPSWEQDSEGQRVEYLRNAGIALDAADAVARPAAPTTDGEPAAWGLADPDDYVFYAGALRDTVERLAAHSDVPCRIVPLGRLDRRSAPAPAGDPDEGTAAVAAAAPPGDYVLAHRDELRSARWCRYCPSRATGYYEGEGGYLVHHCDEHAREGASVPLAPPAGHEDEAAVERAAPSLALLLADVERHITRQEDRANRHLLRRVRAALAAARGPRTPDPGTDQ